MYRFRTNINGVTRFSIAAIKHLPKVGKILKIKGYRCRKNGNEYVMVKGDKGTARFGGFCWGYFGEGPRGLIALLKACGLSHQFAENITFHSYRSDAVGTDWQLDLTGTIPQCTQFYR